jgi:hypothetical protein
MALFSKSPETNLTRDRDTAKANAARLAGKLAAAIAAVTVTKSNSHRAALDGDDTALGVAESAEIASLHHLSVMRTACEAADKLLALLESQLATLADEKLRSVTNSSTRALADELIEAGAAFDATTALLNEVCERCLAVTPEARGLHIFTASSRIEVGVACTVVAEELRQHGRAVLNKLAPAAMPKVPEPPAKVVPKVPEPLTRVFATKPLKWLDHDGKQRACGKFVDCDLPAATAKRALASGAALELSNPERKKCLGTWPGNYSLSACFDLDAAAPSTDAAPLQHDPIKHGAFEERIGKPYQLRVAGGTS